VWERALVRERERRGVRSGKETETTGKSTDRKCEGIRYWKKKEIVKEERETDSELCERVIYRRGKGVCVCVSLWEVRKMRKRERVFPVPETNMHECSSPKRINKGDKLLILKGWSQRSLFRCSQSFYNWLIGQFFSPTIALHFKEII